MVFLGVWISTPSDKQKIIWLLVGVFFLYLVPGLHYLVLLLQHKIDTEVKDSIKRQAILKVAILSQSCFLVLTVFFTGPYFVQRFLLGALIVSLFFIFLLNRFNFELSVHVGIVSFLGFFLINYLSWYFLFIFVPALFITGWSRYVLGMHTFWEIVGGFLITTSVYLIVIIF